MGLRWTDTMDIAIELYEAHPDVDPQWIHIIQSRYQLLS